MAEQPKIAAEMAPLASELGAAANVTRTACAATIGYLLALEGSDLTTRRYDARDSDDVLGMSSADISIAAPTDDTGLWFSRGPHVLLLSHYSATSNAAHVPPWSRVAQKNMPGVVLTCVGSRGLDATYTIFSFSQVLLHLHCGHPRPAPLPRRTYSLKCVFPNLLKSGCRGRA